VRSLTFTGDSAVGFWPSGGFQGLTASLLDSLRRGRIYVNIPTAANLNGEIRGQVDGSFFMDVTAAAIAVGDSLVRSVSFAPVAAAPFSGSIRVVSNDPDPVDDTLFVSLSGTGAEPPVSVGGLQQVIPATFELAQNFPNPFNPTTRIEFGLPEESEVKLRIYNLLGQEVVGLWNGSRSAGYHSLHWDGHNADGTPAGTGVYFYRLEAQSRTGQTYIKLRKMILLK
jgi:hypothetical protein